MAEHPPPAPDWILGDDGHWKPPPFGTSGPLRPTPAPAPQGPPPQGPPPGFAGPPAWGPPPPQQSTGRTVAIVLGSIAAVGVLGIGLLVGAVTFLGTEAEPRFTPVGSSLPADDPFGDPADDPADPADDPSSTTAAGDPGVEADDLTPSELATEHVFDVLSDGWTPTGGEALAPDEGTADSCYPAGWLGGATDRFRSYWDRPGGPVTDALTLSITTYGDEAAAAAELERARSPEYQACEVEQSVAHFPGSTDATVTALPDDPAAPGIAYEVVPIGIAHAPEYDITVVVGRTRAHLDFCGCADMTVAEQRQVARDVAGAIATAQGLPAPG